MENPNPKQLDILQTHTLRELIQVVNSLGIQKEDIVGFTTEEEAYSILYYK